MICIFIYTYVYTWTLVNEVKHHESNLTPCWAESEGSQNGFPAEPMIRFFDEKICGIGSFEGSISMMIFPAKKTPFWVGSKNTCRISISILFFEGSYDHEGMKGQLSFTFSSWQSEDSRVTIVLEFSLITTLENQRYHWNNGDLMAFY